MPDQIDTYAIEFNRSVLKGLRLSIADIYNQLVKHGRDRTNAEEILKRRIDRIAMTELCPQVFKAITEQYEMMKQPNSAMIKNGIRYDQFNWDIKDTETLDILRKNNVFLTSKYYNRLDAENITEKIAQVFEQGKSPSSVANGLRREFGGVYKNLSAYNEMFVDTISHTARNFANINTYQQIGVEYTQIVGFRDELLCPQCSRLIGRIESVKTISKAMNDYLAVDFEKLGYDKAIEEIKKVNGWVTEKSLINKGVEKPNYNNDAENHADTKKLFSSGIPIPAHGHCRCSRKAVFKLENKNSLPLVSGAGGGILPVKNKFNVVNFKTKTEVDNYIKSNLANKLEDLRFSDNDDENLLITNRVATVIDDINKKHNLKPLNAIRIDEDKTNAAYDIYEDEISIGKDVFSFFQNQAKQLTINIGMPPEEFHTVFQYPGKEIESIIAHEMGHRIKTLFEDDIDDIFAQHNDWDQSFKVSSRCTQDKDWSLKTHETIAENYVKYYHDGDNAKIHPDLLKFFKGIKL